MAKKTAKKAPAKKPSSTDVTKAAVKGGRAASKGKAPAKVAKSAPAPAKVAKVAPSTEENEYDGVHSWHGLQEVLRNTKTAADAKRLLDYEIDGPARLRWMLRIQGRFNALRNDEEITYLESIARS